jgi:hypothetical protein
MTLELTASPARQDDMENMEDLGDERVHGSDSDSDSECVFALTVKKADGKITNFSNVHVRTMLTRRTMMQPRRQDDNGR